MKKGILIITLIGLSFGIKAQNTFPTSGNVGIGTTSPNEKLQINGNLAAFEGNIFLNNSAINQEDSGTIRWNEYADNNLNMSGAFMRYNGNGNYLQFMTNTENTEYEHLRINRGGNFLIQPTSGNVGIGTINPGSWRLAVNGQIRAKEIKVETGWSDFVFYDDYKLPTLQEVENYIKESGHLKDIPSAKEVEKNGIFLGEMDSKLLQKIEELTLYTIQQEKKIEKLEGKNEQLTLLNEKLLELQKRMEILENK